MSKRKFLKPFIIIIIVAMFCCLSFVACQSKTPYIGENGNWWIGDEDLDVSAQGIKGEKGDQGEKGAQGESGIKEIEFIPGKELTCPQGNSFKMYGKAYIYGGLSTGGMPIQDVHENYEVEITSFKAIMLKEADMNNIDDYCGKQTFFPYIYEIEVSGKIDPKYSAMTAKMGVRFAQDGDLTFYDVHFCDDPTILGNFIKINNDGSFNLKTRVGYCSVQETIMITSLYSYGNLK